MVVSAMMSLFLAGGIMVTSLIGVGGGGGAGTCDVTSQVSW